VIEAKPTLGQISPSEAAMAPGGQTERRVGDYRGLLTRGETTRRGIACAFASAAAKRRVSTTGSFRIFAEATEFCAAAKRFGQREDPVCHDEVVHWQIPRHGRTMGSICLIWWRRDGD
jgi:hypothetical protein